MMSEIQPTLDNEAIGSALVNGWISVLRQKLYGPTIRMLLRRQVCRLEKQFSALTMYEIPLQI